MRSKQNSLLWSVADSNGIRGYLFGTMHVRDQSAYRYVRHALDHMSQCKIYAAEMDLDTADPFLFQQAAQLPVNQSIRSYLSVRHYERVRLSLLRSFGIDLDQWVDKHPFLIISIISEMILRRDQSLALDEHLWQQAGSMDLSMHGLESFAAQLEVMRRMPVEDHIRNLRTLARNPAKFRKQIRSLVSYYRKQDIRSIYLSSKRQLGKMRKMMLYERNKVMADRIIELLQRGKLFSAFGAAHLGGGKGVLALLQKKDFSVKPIKLHIP